MLSAKELFIGKNENGEELVRTAEELSSLLIGGCIGSGKSVFLHNLIRQVTELYQPDEARIVLIDPKCIEFSEYRENANLFCPVVTDSADAEKVLESLLTETHKYAVYVFLDEYADWSADPGFRNAITELAKNGKSRKIYLFSATQCVTEKFLSEEFIGAFDKIAALKTADEDGSRLLIGDASAERLPYCGKMILFDHTIGEKMKVTFAADNR